LLLLALGRVEHAATPESPPFGPRRTSTKQTQCPALGASLLIPRSAGRMLCRRVRPRISENVESPFSLGFGASRCRYPAASRAAIWSFKDQTALAVLGACFDHVFGPGR